MKSANVRWICESDDKGVEATIRKSFMSIKTRVESLQHYVAAYIGAKIPYTPDGKNTANSAKHNAKSEIKRLLENHAARLSLSDDDWIWSQYLLKLPDPRGYVVELTNWMDDEWPRWAEEARTIGNDYMTMQDSLPKISAGKREWLNKWCHEQQKKKPFAKSKIYTAILASDSRTMTRTHLVDWCAEHTIETSRNDIAEVKDQFDVALQQYVQSSVAVDTGKGVYTNVLTIIRGMKLYGDAIKHAGIMTGVRRFLSPFVQASELSSDDQKTLTAYANDEDMMDEITTENIEQTAAICRTAMEDKTFEKSMMKLAHRLRGIQNPDACANAIITHVALKTSNHYVWNELIREMTTHPEDYVDAPESRLMLAGAWVDLGPNNGPTFIEAACEAIEDYLNKAAELRAKHPPEAPQDAPLNQYAFAQNRSSVVPPETDNDYEKKLLHAIIDHFNSNRSIKPEHTDRIQAFLKNGWYKDVFHEPESSTLIYRGMSVDTQYLRDVLQRENIESSGSLEHAFTFTPLPGRGSTSWTLLRYKAKEFVGGGQYHIILTAQGSDNQYGFIMGPGGLYDLDITPHSSEKEVVGLGPIKVIKIEWRTMDPNFYDPGAPWPVTKT